MPSVLITGTSTGIGNAACHKFAEEGWTVYAGSRSPNPENYHHKSIKPTLFDVNDTKAVGAFFAGIRSREDRLDCVVNNAGWGKILLFEETPEQTVEDIFRTNVFGPMDVCRQACSLMRSQGEGCIVNVSSVFGFVGVPTYSIYCASKWALEGFTEALAHEMHSTGVRIKLVEPGSVDTDFYKNATGMDRTTPAASSAEHLAEVIYRAAIDSSHRLRYIVGDDAKLLMNVKKFLPDRLFQKLMYRRYRGRM